MEIKARIENSLNSNQVFVETNGRLSELSIPSKESGRGSAVNGGEFLCLALATCFCNDIYREAQKQNITITKVVVEASAEFSAEGQAGFNIVYSAKLEGNASQEVLAELVQHTDKVAEIQNTLRAGVGVKLLQ
ncbi:OsmC family protein [Cesiribacter sp. SM1]|uniref:OsmC family protein n=1 Tax=Cesiribacter sp. SM1 TaxID=2861196 RepID=UPI001CD3E89C|nr:OsmC family protein [Cesiribacter sp. SM1]